MKKLAFLLLLLFGFFGFSSSASTWTFGDIYPSTTTSNATSLTRFSIDWASWNIINLYQVFDSYLASTGCDQRRIYWENILGTPILLYTWNTSFDASHYLLVNKNITLGKYSVYSFALSCTTLNWTNSTSPLQLRYNSWFFHYLYISVLWNLDWRNYSLLSTSAISSNYWYWPTKFIFSWADPRIVVPTPTIYHYNWTSSSLSVSDIYLSWLNINYSFTWWNTFLASFSWWYTITSPFGVSTISNNLTLTWNVNRVSWYPDYIAKNITWQSTVINNWTTYSYTWLLFNITWVANVIVSWSWLYVYPNAIIPPTPRTWAIYLTNSWSYALSSWNVQVQFAENLTKLVMANLWKIVLALSSLLIIWLILKVFWIKLHRRRKPMF